MGEKKFKENCVVLVIHPTEGRLWWLEPVSSLPTVGARRKLACRGVRGVVGTEFGHTRPRASILPHLLVLDRVGLNF
jgi:hypothetical protein